MHLYGVGSSYHIQLLFGAMRTGRQDKRPDGRDVKIYFSRFLLPARVFFYVSVSASAKKKNRAIVGPPVRRFGKFSSGIVGVVV